jgi:hypothetical protein
MLSCVGKIRYIYIPSPHRNAISKTYNIGAKHCSESIIFRQFSNINVPAINTIYTIDNRDDFLYKNNDIIEYATDFYFYQQPEGSPKSPCTINVHEPRNTGRRMDRGTSIKILGYKTFENINEFRSATDEIHENPLIFALVIVISQTK